MRHIGIGRFSSVVAALCVCVGIAQATDISGTITTTLTIMETSRLVDDVTCTVTGAPCIAFGASALTLDLNGFSMTGQGDPQTACGGSSIGSEVGIMVSAVNNVVIRGPGVVQRFRNIGILLTNSTGSMVTGVTSSTNCASGIMLVGGSGHLLENNISVRNGNAGALCGGI